ncbi:hypothetical protein ABN702_15825 [Bacillus haimaensis]|uniref:hypothetical protein n=1 Tax=Bacillus haimaensis TaxID=3160967 RepID=UPI003AA973CD
MRTNFNLLLLVIFSFGITLGCSNETVKPNSPENTTWLMKLAIDNVIMKVLTLYFLMGGKGVLPKVISKILKIKRQHVLGTQGMN